MPITAAVSTARSGAASRRLARRTALSLALVVLTAVLTATGANASTTTWQHSMTTAEGTQSKATITWQTSPLSVTLTVTTGVLASGKCVTAFFDWAAAKHYDARAIRDCRSNDTLTHTFNEPSGTGLSGRASKYGMCYAIKDQHGTCVGQGSIHNDWTPWPDTSRTDPCDMSWVLKNSNGTITSFIDPHPLTPSLVNGSC
jgi:hypothetical protein